MANVPDARQMLRWLIRDNTALTPGLDALLSSALEDVDWELRASAMLAVSLFEAWHRLPQVRRIEWRDGPIGTDARILRAWLGAVLDRAPVHRTDPRDRETMLLYALLNPLEGVDPTTHPHRPGYRFVPPVAHWLGHRRSDIRRKTPAGGFWISENRVGEASFEDASRGAAEQSHRSGMPVRLPLADEWEMAARGTDGRLFPWGNGNQPDAAETPSPWGLEGLMAGSGEWCIGADGARVLCGHDRDAGVGARMIDAPADLAGGYRLVVDF